MLTYKTAGESHGCGCFALVEGFPAGHSVSVDRINAQLHRRQGGYGRGGRQAIETDRVEFLSGVVHGKTNGAPILLRVGNKDSKLDAMPELTAPRPGHADFAGAMKYKNGIRAVLERASARETAGRVAAGALAADLLLQFGIETVGYVTQVGSLSLTHSQIDRLSPEQIRVEREKSQLFTLLPERDHEAIALIDQSRAEGDTLGGIVEARVFGLPLGLGSHVQYDQKLDARLALAAMSIQAIKGVEIGIGFQAASLPGSMVHDEILPPKEGSSRFYRPTNRAGGIEGGMSNGEPIVLRAAMKPIATLKKPLRSVDLSTGQPIEASFERSDVCAISATSVILENITAFEIASVLINKLGGDSLAEMKEHARSLKL